MTKTGKEKRGPDMKRAINSSAWAIGSRRRNGFHVRRIVWGLLLAQYECRDGEEIRAATIMVERAFKRRRDIREMKL